MLAMNTGMIIAVVFLGIIILLNRGGEIKEHLMEFIDRMNERKHVSKKYVPTRIKKLKKRQVVKTLTEGQIPQVKKQIKEISILINRHRDTIHQLRNAAVTCACRSGLTAGRVQYEKEYARQLNMINVAIPRLIAEADRISAVDEDYKQRIHNWVLAIKKSLENYDPKHFERMAREGKAHCQKPSIGNTQSPL